MNVLKISICDSQWMNQQIVYNKKQFQLKTSLTFIYKLYDHSFTLFVDKLILNCWSFGDYDK